MIKTILKCSLIMVASSCVVPGLTPKQSVPYEVVQRGGHGVEKEGYTTFIDSAESLEAAWKRLNPGVAEKYRPPTEKIDFKSQSAALIYIGETWSDHYLYIVGIERHADTLVIKYRICIRRSEVSGGNYINRYIIIKFPKTEQPPIFEGLEKGNC